MRRFFSQRFLDNGMGAKGEKAFVSEALDQIFFETTLFSAGDGFSPRDKSITEKPITHLCERANSTSFMEYMCWTYIVLLARSVRRNIGPMGAKSLRLQILKCQVDDFGHFEGTMRGRTKCQSTINCMFLLGNEDPCRQQNEHHCS